MTIILLVKQGIVKKNVLVACLRVFEKVELSVWSQVTESITLLLIQFYDCCSQSCQNKGNWVINLFIMSVGKNN